jgi:hypothetical protein
MADPTVVTPEVIPDAQPTEPAIEAPVASGDNPSAQAEPVAEPVATGPDPYAGRRLPGGNVEMN